MLTETLYVHNVCFNLLCFNGTNAISQSSVPSISVILMNEPSTSIAQHLNFAQCATMHAIQQSNSVSCEGYYMHGLVHHIVECLYIQWLCTWKGYQGWGLICYRNVLSWE